MEWQKATQNHKTQNDGKFYGTWNKEKETIKQNHDTSHGRVKHSIKY